MLLPAQRSDSPAHDDDHAWLPQTPPPAIARLTGWLVLVLAALAVVATISIRLPETVRCRFALVPEGGADPVQAPLAGILHSVQAVEGAEVDAGAVLVEIRSGEILTWQTDLKAAQEELRVIEDQIARTEQAHLSLLRIKDAELEQVKSERNFREQHLANLEDLVRRHRELRVDGLISEVEMLQTELTLAGARKDLAVTDQAIEKIKLQRQELESQRERQRTEERASIEKLRIQAGSLQRRLVHSDGDLRRVVAPYRAVVLSLARHNAGSVVREGEELCQLAPAEARVRARLVLPQTGLDRVQPGQPVRLHFDAFPYQRYGAIPATLEWITAGAVRTTAAQQFEALARLERSELTIRGRAVPLRPGMEGEARVRVGTRTLAEFALEPLRAVREQVR